MKSLYEHHHQQQHQDLMNVLSQVLKEFHTLSFHYWATESITIDGLSNETCDLLWHQRSIHCGQHTLKDMHKYMDGIPNLSNTKFNDLTKCVTCLKASLTKASAGHSSLFESLSCPYQGLYVDFGFPGHICEDKDGKAKKFSCVDIEGLNREQAWILISDGKICMLHGDTQLTKAYPLKYLESVLSEYAPEYKNKWVVLNQGSKLYGNVKIKNLFLQVWL